MKKFVAAGSLLIITASLAFAVQEARAWIEYTSTEGRYSINLPAQPQLSAQDATAADGQTFTQYLASVVQPGDVGFMVGYFDTVAGTVFNANAARDGMVKRINGTLISETAISLGGYPGRELKVSAKPAPATPAEGEKPAEPVEYIVRARFFEVDKRVYVVQLIFPKAAESESLNATANKYFDSFQVVKN